MSVNECIRHYYLEWKADWNYLPKAEGLVIVYRNLIIHQKALYSFKCLNLFE